MEIITQDRIMSAISAVAETLRNGETRVHEIAFSTLDHIRQHGDSSGAVALLNALPKGTRVQGLAAWYRHMSSGKIALRQDTNKVWICALKERTDSDFLMDEAETTTFADLTEEGQPKQKDVADVIKMLERVSTDDGVIKSGPRKGLPRYTLAARAQAATILAFVRTQKAA